MPAIWKDAAGNLLELAGPGGGIVVCGALPGAAAPVPAWVPGELAAAGVAASPGPVREGTGLGLVTSVTGPALIGEALAGTPARRARKITPRLMMELSLARALEPGTAPAVLRALAQRPREADPGYDLPAASSLSDADAFLQVKPFLRLLALLCWRGPAGAAARREARAGRARHAGRGPGRDPAAAAGAAGRAVAGRPLARAAGAGQGRHRPRRRRPQGHRPQRQRRAVPQRRALRPAASTGAPAAPQARMVEVTDVWARSCAAWAAGPCRTGETTLAACLEPAYGPGDLDLADRGFPSRQAAVAKITAGKHFAWRVSSAWNLRRRGRPLRRRYLEDGDHLARAHRQGPRHRIPHGPGFDLPPGHPLLATPPAGVSVRVLDDSDGPPGGMCRQPGDGTIRVEVSETVTIITSLTDPAACPAGDIAELYGLRWAAELVYLEEKQTLSAGQPITAATPAGAYRMAAATVAAHQALRIAGAAIAAAIGAEPARISATALRDAATASVRAGQGCHPPRPGRRHRHHQPRHRPAPAAVRHRLAARTALPPLHHQESQDPQKQARRPRRDPAAPAPAAGRGAVRAAERAASPLTPDPPARPGTAAPGPRHAPRSAQQPPEHRSPRPGAPAARRDAPDSQNVTRTAAAQHIRGHTAGYTT